MPDETFFCEHCVADNELKLEIQERGEPAELCPICHRTGGRSISCCDPHIKRIFRALVRLNYSEWDYNNHVGGDSLEGLIFRDKAIFNLPPNADLGAFEEVFLGMEEDWYPIDSKGEPDEEAISLGGGYWDGGVLNGVRDQRDYAVEAVIESALQKNWFHVQPAVVGLIEDVRPDITALLPAGSVFYRARVGVKSRLARRHPGPNQERDFRYLPYTGKEIDKPPLKLAAEGRFNRAHVSLLYLASHMKTAVAELRPHPGHIVSTAEFVLKRDLKIANFASHDIRKYLSDTRLERLRRILSIADVLNVPVQPEHRVLYSVTQLFSDVLREVGFDGLTYSSSLGAGHNLTCFIEDAFEEVPGKGTVQDVVELQYRIEPSGVIEAGDAADAWKEDGDSPLATLLHGMARGKP